MTSNPQLIGLRAFLLAKREMIILLALLGKNDWRLKIKDVYLQRNYHLRGGKYG